jgi:hypothetical protein
MVSRLRVLKTGVVLLTLTVLGVQVSARLNTADVIGKVTDTQGKVIPSATLTATSKATNATRSTTMNESGVYTITQLPPGQNDVTVEAQSFSKALVS